MGTIVLTLVLAIIGIYFVKNISEKTTSQKESNNQSIKVVNVEEVVRTPDQYKGFWGIEGRVIRIDESKNLFLLGCEDACIFMPVKYKGQMPELNNKIVIFGEIKKQEDGRYIFEGKKLK